MVYISTHFYTSYYKFPDGPLRAVSMYAACVIPHLLSPSEALISSELRKAFAITLALLTDCSQFN